MGWVFYVLVAIAGLTSYNIVGKVSGGKIEPLLSSAIACLAAGIILSTVTAIYYWKNGLSLASVTLSGVQSSLLLSLTIVVVNTGYIFAFTKGGPIGIVGPVVSGASIGLVVVASALFFGEGMSINKMLGAAFLGLGILFIMKG